MKILYSKKRDGNKYATLSDGTKSKYFKIKEFSNIESLIDGIMVDEKTTDLLEKVRIEFGVPVYIQVANRNYPEASYHNPSWGESCAVDIDVGNTELGTKDYEKVCRFLEKTGLAGGIGRYDYIENGVPVKFIHLDARKAQSRWRCNKVVNGNQVLEHINSFMPPYPVPVRILKLSLFRMTGLDVKWLQNGLALNGIECVVDGVFGKNTEIAVKTFQKKYGLVIDGKAGINTISTLREVEYL